MAVPVKKVGCWKILLDSRALSLFGRKEVAEFSLLSRSPIQTAVSPSVFLGFLAVFRQPRGEYRVLGCAEAVEAPVFLMPELPTFRVSCVFR